MDAEGEMRRTCRNGSSESGHGHDLVISGEQGCRCYTIEVAVAYDSNRPHIDYHAIGDTAASLRANGFVRVFA